MVKAPSRVASCVSTRKRAMPACRRRQGLTTHRSDEDTQVGQGACHGRLAVDHGMLAKEDELAWR